MKATSLRSINTHIACTVIALLLGPTLLLLASCKKQTPPPTDEGAAEEPVTAHHVRPGESIQSALELAAKSPERKRVIVHAGTYRPKQSGQAMIWFNKRHDGITLEAEGEVILTAANPEIADNSEPSFPAVVNHVVYFGDGISRKTVFRGFKITGANGFATIKDEPANIQPAIDAPNMERAKFFYTDGGGIKIFGRSYPTIDSVEIYDNFASPCGAALSVEHRGHFDRSNTTSTLITNCIFRNNRCPVTGAAVDLLHGSSAEIVNCLFVANMSNDPMDQRATDTGKWKPKHGSGALTLFPNSHVIVRRCTFTANRNGIDDASEGNTYEDSIFWKNNAAGGWPTMSRYELDLIDGKGVKGCFLGGDINDLKGNVDDENNIKNCPDPIFDNNYVPQATEFENVGYRPLGS